MAVSEKSGIAIDFRQLLMVGSGLLEFRNYRFDDSVFEEGEQFVNRQQLPVEWIDNCLIVVKSKCRFDLVEDRMMQE
jgi:hypothetical protein